jgi:hypothetical protein
VTALKQLLATQRLEDVPELAEALGCRRCWEEIPPSYWLRRPADSPCCSRSALVGQLGNLPWFALATATPIRTARQVAGRLLRRGEPAAVMGIDLPNGVIALAVAFQGVPVLSLRPIEDEPLLSSCLSRISRIPPDGRLAIAARLAEVISIEGMGERFFAAFERRLDATAESITTRNTDERRSLALLQLNRVLFLYFVQSKGWLDGKTDFLRRQVDGCLSRSKTLDRHLLRPLFFGTLNRSAAERSQGARAFGRIPFLNGGLFEPHPLERQWRGTIPNRVWRDTFDDLFERFHFTASEGTGTAIAPDMLGRVFEGVMASEERRRSGTFYTPPVLVRALLDECLTVLLAIRLQVGAHRADQLLADRDPSIRPPLHSLTLLDPAVGSGAFLLAALERLAELTAEEGEPVAAARRRILQNNLFGVDINPTAVRLSELRLWLSVIARDDSQMPEQVSPLPNLDCVVRQGDSLTDPLGLIARMPFRIGAMGSTLANLRLAFSRATGNTKREAARAVRKAEYQAMADCLDLAEQRLNESIGDLLRAGRSADLFGEKRGIDRSISRQLADLRRRAFPIRQARRRLQQEGEIGWFQYESHFGDVFSQRGGFDVVVGNPPWVRAEKLERSVREHLSTRYCWWRGSEGASSGYRHQPDLAVAFLERAHELARPGGVVGLLVPAKLGSAGYGTVARRSLARDLTLNSVAELESSYPAAFDATVYPMAVVTTKQRPGPDHRVRLELGKPSGPSVVQSSLGGGGPWILRRNGAAGIARDLAQRFQPVGGRFAIHLGVKTGANHVFLNPPETLAGSLIRDAFRGRDIEPFRVVRSRPMIWPCSEDGKPLSQLTGNALAHFTVHERTLRSRADYRDGPLWMLFRTIAGVVGPRVVWADLSRTLTAAVLGDTDRRIPLNTCYVIRAPHSVALTLSAWFNSSWMRGLARLQADPASSGFARFNARTIGALPLPESITVNPKLSVFAALASRGSYLQEELDELTAPHLDLSPTALRTLASVA